MDNWTLDERVRPLAVAFTTMVVIVTFLLEDMHVRRLARYKEPSIFQDLTRKKHMDHLLWSGRDYYVSYLRTDVDPFMHLASILCDKHLLIDSRNTSVEEQLAMFMDIVGHNTKN